MAVRRWSGSGSGGLWGSDAGWGAVRPGTGDQAVVAGPEVGSGAGALGLQGPGVAGEAVLSGVVTLAGAYTLGTLTVGSATAAGLVTVGGGGASVSAQVANVAYGTLTATGAGTLVAVAGVATLGGRRGVAGFDNPGLSAVLGAVVRVGALTLLPSTYAADGVVFTTGLPMVSVDGTGVIEVGGAGLGAAGRITVDAGGVLRGAGTLVAGGRGIVDDGVILAEGDTLSTSETISGAGVLQIGSGGTLSLTGQGASYVPVGFVGVGGTLSVNLAGSAGVGLFNAAGAIGGFVIGDSIRIYAYGATGAVYVAGPNGGGWLEVRSNGTLLGRLSVLGGFHGEAVHGDSGWGALVVGLQADPGGVRTVSGGTVAPDTFAWALGSGGAWGVAANWRDVTTGTVQAVAPGANNRVVLTNTGVLAQTVYGPGDAALLTVVGANALNGSFRLGGLGVGSVEAAGSLALAAGSVVTAGSVGVLAGTLTVAGSGTSLAVAGGVTLGGVRGSAGFVSDALVVQGGASVRAGVVVLGPGLFGGVVVGGASVSVDAGSVLEVGGGTAGGVGRVVVDGGAVLSGSGEVSAAGGIVDDGVIRAMGGVLSLRSGVSGAGVLEVGVGATLVLGAGAAVGSVRFAGATGTLVVQAGVVQAGVVQAGVVQAGVVQAGVVQAGVGGVGLTGAVSGFGPGDVIAVSGLAADGVAWTDGPGGVGALTLTLGGAVVGRIAVAGDYGSVRFGVAADAGLPGAVDVVGRAAGAGYALFDAAYYLARYADVAAAGVDAYTHYVTYGWREGRDPSALFSTTYYLNQNPDVRAAGVDPLEHYALHGWMEGRDPSVAFSVAGYGVANPDVAGLDPLRHYMAHGRTEGRAVVRAVPHTVGPQDVLVDARAYWAAHPEVAAAGLDASAQYHAQGWRAGYNPDGWFDTSYYLAANPDVAAAGVDPLLHYEVHGWQEGRAPSLLFDPAKYLAAYADVRASGGEPLADFVTRGQGLGRVAPLPGGVLAADPLVDVGYYDRQLGATLVPGGVAAGQQAAWSYDQMGWQRGLNPDALFDTAYYLAHNPDVAAAHINPLLHYENYGWHEGRDPSALFSTSRYLAAYVDVAAAGVDPLLHYVVHGAGEGRTIFAAG